MQQREASYLQRSTNVHYLPSGQTDRRLYEIIRVSGCRGQTKHDPRLPQSGRERAARHMRGHSHRSRQAPYTQLADRRVQGLLLQNEGKPLYTFCPLPVQTFDEK